MIFLESSQVVSTVTIPYIPVLTILYLHNKVHIVLERLLNEASLRGVPHG